MRPSGCHDPATDGDQPDAGGTPTGIVFNNTSGFLVNGKPAAFIFDTEDGTISAWNGGNNAVIEVDNSGTNFTETDPAKQTGAVYKGLAGPAPTGRPSSTPPTSARATSTCSTAISSSRRPRAKCFHTDPHIPSGFAPFGIQTINGNLYVTYAKQDAAKHDDVAGPGQRLRRRLRSQRYTDPARRLPRHPSTRRGASPLPRPDFGQFSGDLLVGNFGNGHVNAFRPQDRQVPRPAHRPQSASHWSSTAGSRTPPPPATSRACGRIAFDNGVSNGTDQHHVLHLRHQRRDGRSVRNRDDRLDVSNGRTRATVVVECGDGRTPARSAGASLTRACPGRPGRRCFRSSVDPE